MNNLLSHSFLAGIIAASTAPAGLARERAPVLEEIIVTAEKRSESLQELSQAVTALSGEDLDNRHITTFVDLGGIAPGVTVVKNEGYKTVIAIRGVGNEANQNSIANPSVSYHLDGIYVASPFALRTDFLDLERVEVLRGPQGTLFGQNSTGGAINVITRAPDTEAFSGRADITAGNYNLVRRARRSTFPSATTWPCAPRSPPTTTTASAATSRWTRGWTRPTAFPGAPACSGRPAKTCASILPRSITMKTPTGPRRKACSTPPRTRAGWPRTGTAVMNWRASSTAWLPNWSCPRSRSGR